MYEGLCAGHKVEKRLPRGLRKSQSQLCKGTSDGATCGPCSHSELCHQGHTGDGLNFHPLQSTGLSECECVCVRAQIHFIK